MCTVPSSAKLVLSGQLWLPSVRMFPVTFLSPLLSPPYLSSFLSFNGSSTLSPAAKQLTSKFCLGRRPPNSRLKCGRDQRPLLDPVVPEVNVVLGLAPRGQQGNFGLCISGHTWIQYVLLM